MFYHIMFLRKTGKKKNKKKIQKWHILCVIYIKIRKEKILILCSFCICCKNLYVLHHIKIWQIKKWYRNMVKKKSHSPVWLKNGKITHKRVKICISLNRATKKQQQEKQHINMFKNVLPLLRVKKKNIQYWHSGQLVNT